MASPYKYGKLQRAGLKQQLYISDRSVACPVPRCTLNPSAFDQDDDWVIERETDVLPDELLSEPVMKALSLKTNDDIEKAKFEFTSLERTFTDSRGQERVTCRWNGRIARGTIFIEDVMRASNVPNAHISEISQAVYTRKYNIETLQRVFVADIINVETANFIKNQLYAQENGLAWPDPQERIWAYGSPEYQALMGTPIGKMVAALVLGAFPQGTRRISKIASWSNSMPQLRFDIVHL